MLTESFTSIGIVGAGFVGTAIQEATAGMCNLIVYDLNKSKCTYPNRTEEFNYEQLNDCEGVFICVPSPSTLNGDCDTTILESVLERFKDYSGVIISKVTAPPEVYTRLGKQYKNLVYVPEFLTAAEATRDYLNATFTVIGGTTPAYMREAKRLIALGQSSCKSNCYASLEEAALLKYTINSFLATKVVFMNEIAKLAEAIPNVKYENIVQMLSLDDRIGKTHLRVPGRDSKYGFGGMCFPKDTAAMINFANDLGVELSVLESAIKKNTLLRLS